MKNCSSPERRKASEKCVSSYGGGGGTGGVLVHNFHFGNRFPFPSDVKQAIKQRAHATKKTNTALEASRACSSFEFYFSWRFLLIFCMTVCNLNSVKVSCGGESEISIRRANVSYR